MSYLPLRGEKIKVVNDPASLAGRLVAGPVGIANNLPFTTRRQRTVHQYVMTLRGKMEVAE